MAKALRATLQERFGPLGALFYIREDLPEPRWAQVKYELNRVRAERVAAEPAQSTAEPAVSG